VAFIRVNEKLIEPVIILCNYPVTKSPAYARGTRS